MKPEEVIDALNYFKRRKEMHLDDLIQKRENIAIQALEKQVPKKPILCGENPDGTYQFRCSDCGRLWWEKSHITKYCDGCGREIDREVK